MKTRKLGREALSGSGGVSYLAQLVRVMVFALCTVLYTNCGMYDAISTVRYNVTMVLEKIRS